MAGMSARYREWHTEEARRKREHQRQVRQAKTLVIVVAAWAIGALCGIGVAWIAL